MDVLILSVSAGGGHGRAAFAIKEKLEQRYPGSRCLIVDTLKYINPIVNKLIIGSYLNAVRKTPQIYGKLYKVSENGYSICDLSKTVNKLLSFGIINLINEYDPSAIVCTHPFPLQMLSSLKIKNRIDVPSVGILTDFVVHPLWFHDCVDAYIVDHENMKVQMASKGIPDETIYAYGIPTSSEFLVKKDRKTVLGQLGLDDMLTVLIMGGSLGYGEIENVYLSLLNSERNIQIVVLTGKNQKLKHQLEKYALDTRKKASIVGYTNNVSDYMDAADFLITKPGGMTISEALIKQIPILVMSPIPGQEEGNANYLIKNGAAARILDNNCADKLVDYLAGNPLRMMQMKEAAKLLSRPYASENIVNLLQELVYHGTSKGAQSSIY